MTKRTCLSLFCGIGGGSMGMSDAGFDTIGIDVDADCVRDYRALTGHPAYVMDMADVLPYELRASINRPDVVLLSPPCKAFSGCLPVKTSKTKKYLKLSSLAERGLWVVLEAWADNPPRLILLENVPRIQSRGRQWLDGVAAMLAHYGYAFAETTHDCADLGGLAQHRRRFLGVARHMASTPEWLYQPTTQPLATIGGVIGDLPVPGPWAPPNPMHRLSRLSPLNWLRLALIPSGGDWRDLPDRVIITDQLVDPQSTCDRRAGAMGVTGWDNQTHAVIGAASIQNTGLQVADPRLTCTPRSGAYGLSGWDAQTGTVVGAACHDNSSVSTNDPRWPNYTHELVETDQGITLVGPPMDYTNPRLRSLMVIRAFDGTWHRPLTTLELALLQSFPADIRLCGNAHSKWRMRIGNAIPPKAARAIGEQMMLTLDASDNNLFLMSANGIWVDHHVEQEAPR